MATKTQKPKTSPIAIELARINTEAMDRYRTKYYPQEKAFVQDVRQSLPETTQRALNVGNVATQQAFAREAPTVDRNLSVSGVDPSSGRGLSTLSGIQQDKALSGAQNAAQGTQAARTAYYTNLSNLVAKGKGQEAQALQTGSNAADAATRQSIMDARAAAAARSGLKGLAGTAAGIGAGYALTPAAGSSQANMIRQANAGDYTPTALRYPQFDTPQIDVEGLIPQFSVGN